MKKSKEPQTGFTGQSASKRFRAWKETNTKSIVEGLDDGSLTLAALATSMGLLFTKTAVKSRRLYQSGSRNYAYDARFGKHASTIATLIRRVYKRDVPAGDFPTVDESKGEEPPANRSTSRDSSRDKEDHEKSRLRHNSGRSRSRSRSRSRRRSRSRSRSRGSTRRLSRSPSQSRSRRSSRRTRHTRSSSREQERKS